MAPTKLASGSTAPKPSQKRNSSELASDTDSEASIPPTKKARAPTKSTKAATPSLTPSSYTANDLAHLSHAELIAHVLDLQKQLDVIKKSSSSTGSNAPELDPHDLHKKVELLRALVARQIKKAMVWKPSCKPGSATFSQDFVVPHPQVMTKLFARVTKDNKNGKAWKMKNLSAADFESVVGEIDASVRYARLELTSDVTVRWDAENGTMKCSGKYGKWGTGVRNMEAPEEATSID